MLNNIVEIKAIAERQCLIRIIDAGDKLDVKHILDSIGRLLCEAAEIYQVALVPRNCPEQLKPLIYSVFDVVAFEGDNGYRVISTSSPDFQQNQLVELPVGLRKRQPRRLGQLTRISV